MILSLQLKVLFVVIEIVLDSMKACMDDKYAVILYRLDSANLLMI